jgi:inward rectifier potassium channel
VRGFNQYDLKDNLNHNLFISFGVAPAMTRSNFRKPRKPGLVRIASQDGKFQIQGLNQWHNYWRDPYHLMLALPWSGFFGSIAVGYVLLNLMFAVMYVLGGDCLNGARPGNLEDAFFFSVQTFASIGYGAISPKTPYANVIVTLEAIMSLWVIALVTGLVFARFSRPSARVIFSRHVLITPHNGVPTLMLRTANQRRNQILEAEAQVFLTRDERTLEGNSLRRFYLLDLSRSRTPSFALSWNIMHSIDETSPLYGLTHEDLVASQSQLIVSVRGIDETVNYNINARHIYGVYDLLWDHYFMDVIHIDENGDRYIDYSNFHGVKPL